MSYLDNIRHTPAYPLVRYFANIMPLTDEEATAIVESMTSKTFAKGTALLRAGQIATDSYFVLSGCICQYSLVNNEEKISRFFTENEWVLSLTDFGVQTPVNFFWVCCEETTVVIGSDQKAMDLFTRFPRFETISRKILENILLEEQRTITAYLTNTPEERYLNLLNTRPDIFQRVPQYRIASYLGVKPESLSRIRKRIAKKNQSE